MRLFVAVALAPEAAAALAGVQTLLAASAPDLRWSPPQSWHVTLQFLGNANDAQLACLQTQLAGVRAAPLPIQIGGLDFFDRAGVFHAGVALTPELLSLQQSVFAATRACGFVPEDRAYHPHLTLARTKGHAGAAAFASLKQSLQRTRIHLQAEFVAEDFLLFESIPGPGGSRYEIRARFPLASL
ncbi:MAG TPA: RNA 2',3'-cyclic phosphodiesterase [Acidobacteriaceae bacterium]|jgi:2'-5' RNA ligase|nr:RNA 2',3'-cyclic phosphodiesterase [Acidobacteriaceae bacterium]